MAADPGWTPTDKLVIVGSEISLTQWEGWKMGRNK
jgi:hypothetical protein